MLSGPYLVQLPQVLLLLLVHDDVDAGDRLADDADLGELGGRAAGDLGHAEGGELGLELVQLLGQLLLLLGAKLAALDLALEGGNHKGCRVGVTHFLSTHGIDNGGSLARKIGLAI